MPQPPHPPRDDTPGSPPRLVPIIGTVGDDGRVRFTDPAWRDPAKRPRPAARPRLRIIDG